MLSNKVIIMLIIVAGLFLYSQGGAVENLGSDFFHRGKLADINAHIQAQVAKARKYYNNKESVKEGFASLEEMPTDYVPELKNSMKDKPLEKYNPNRYVISDYSFKAVKAEDVDLDKIQVGQLEAPEFAQPIDYSGVKPLADYLEVDSYNSGSGDISDLKEAYRMVNKEQYFQTLKAVRASGGNVHIYETKPFKAGKSKDIVGFL